MDEIQQLSINYTAKQINIFPRRQKAPAWDYCALRSKTRTIQAKSTRQQVAVIFWQLGRKPGAAGIQQHNERFARPTRKMTDCRGGETETKEQITWKYRQENRKSWDSLLLLEEWKGKFSDSRARCTRCRKPGMPAWSCMQWPSCYQQHGLNFSVLRMIWFSLSRHVCFPPGLSRKAVVCELLQPQCRFPGRMWGLLLMTCLCCDLTRAQAFWSCHKHILQFYNQEWHPRNPVLGAVLVILLSLILLFFSHCLHTHFNSDFTSTLIFLL